MSVFEPILGTPLLHKHSLADTNSYSPATKVIAPENSGFAADYYTDGTDDDVQIQAAIAAVNSVGGGSIYIKAGLYNISSNILFDNTSKILLQGEGKYITIIKVVSNSVTGALHFSTSSKITVKDLEIDGNKANYSNAYLISSAGNTSRCLFKDLYIHDSPVHNVQLIGNTSTRLKFETCDIENGTFGVYGEDTIEIDVIDCYLDGNSVIDVYWHENTGGGRDNRVLNSRSVSHTTSWHLRSNIYGSMFNGNHVRNQSTSPSAGGGIAWDKYASIVTNNMIYGVIGDDAIAVSGLGGTISGGVISGNFVDGKNDNNSNHGSLNGIFVGDGAYNVATFGNSLQNNDIGGIRIWGSQYCTYIGNALYNNSNNTAGNNNFSEIWLGTSGSIAANFNIIAANSINTLLSPYSINPRSQGNNIIVNNILTQGVISVIPVANIATTTELNGNIGY